MVRLREADRMLSAGQTIAGVWQKLEISEQTITAGGTASGG